MMSPSFLPATPQNATPLCPHVQVSASTTTIKASKFLSPIMGENPPDLPQCLESPLLSSSPRIRGLSDSELLGMPASSSHPLSRVSVSPSNSPPPPSSTSSPGINGHRLSSFRARSKSFGLTGDQVRGRIVDSPTSPAVGAKWRNLGERSPKPDDLQSGTKSVSVINNAVFDETRKSVAKACLSALGTAALVAREGLIVGLELAEAVPFPPLQPVASTLLAIWDAVQTVNTNQVAFLRLTQRCGNIMISIQQDITTAGDSVGDELELPLAALQSAFHKVQALVDKQNKSPFLKRYLKRDEIVKQIAACGDDLIEALQLFGTSVQIRALKATQEMAAEIRTHSELILNALNNSRKLQDKATLQSDNVIVPAGLPPLASHPSLSPFPISNRFHDAIDSAPTIISTLKELHSLENASDVSSDREYLCTLVSDALDTCSDVELVSFLQIARDGMPEAMKSMQRELESGTGTCQDCCKDTLHKKFIESGIDAIRRLSSDVEISLPSWTITEYEVDLEKQIGIGCFSDVFKGTWNGKTVAIKVLTEAAPPKLFVREMAIWKTLNHPNVLELYGASSATANPPWFFVSPYMKHGSLVEYLKRISMEGELGGLGISASRSQHSYRGSGQVLGEDDIYRFMQEIAKGMEYLHSRDVLHGDLKASNILVDDNLRCVISDFGLSEIKNEAFRITGVTSHGTLRWQSPELMAGLSELTPAVDVYAYAISCVEILTMGRLPWALLDDNAVRYFILKEKTRPQIPENACNPSLRELLQVCWNQDPSVRPSFSDIVSELHRFRRVSMSRSAELAKDTSSPRIRSPLIVEVSESQERQPFSPNVNPTSPPSTPSDTTAQSMHSAFRSSWDSVQYSAVASRIFHKENTVATEQAQMPEPVFYRPSNPPSRASSLCDETIFSENEESRQSICESHISPVPLDENSKEAQNERKYRYLLDHKFHPSLILPLWTPSPVQLGDIGYLSKPSGSFVTLFNAFRPHMSSQGLTGGIPSIAGYGHVAQGSQRQDKRSAAQRGIDAVTGLLTFRTKSNIPISRRFSYPLKTGHKSAYMCTETTEYQYMKTLDSSKAWFKANIDTILDIYGTHHKLHKDDVFLVIGALQASNYALFVSHDHPDGQVHFNVFSSPKKGQPWGTFTTDTKVPTDRGGPCYDEPVHKEQNSSSKISVTGGPQHGLLIARLRFKPDVPEPTSL